MSESAARNMRNQGPAIDLEEFERRLRAPEPARRGDDPLAELARLVGSTNDPFKDMFASAQGAQPQPQPVQPAGYAAGAFGAHEVSADTAPHLLRNVADQMRNASGERPAQADYAQARTPAAEGQGRQGAEYDHMAHIPQPALEQPQAGHWAPEAPPERYEPPSAFAPPPPPAGLEEATREPRRMMSRKSVLYMGSALAVVVIGIGATLATNGKMKSGAVPTIAAPKEPVKVKPEGEQAGARPVRTVAILDRTVGTKPPQSKAVSREEQPVDLAQIPNTPRSGQRVPENDLNRIVNLNNRDAGRPVASVPPPATSAPQAAGYFPEPRKVRTVSVKPDGSIVQPPPAPAATRPPSIPSMAANGPAPRATIAAPAAPSPRIEQAAPAPAPTPAPKSTARANRPPGASQDADAAPVATTRRPESRPATTAERPAAAPQRLAAATPSAAPRAAPVAPASSGGGFAVQLAAPASEAEAQSAAARLRQRFAAELAGRAPSVRAASVGDRTVYRVRVGGLTREDANALCSKLQAKGGACFVARN